MESESLIEWGLEIPREYILFTEVSMGTRRMKEAIKRTLCMLMCALMVITMMPVNAYADSIEAGQLLTTVTDEIETPAEKTVVKESLTVETATEVTETESESEEETLSDKNIVSEDENVVSGDEDVISEDEELIEETVEEEIKEEALLAAGRIELSDKDLSGEGWTYDAASQTLTLDGAIITEPMVAFTDVKIDVVSDSTIDVGSNSSALFLAGTNAKDLEISGKGTLSFITSASTTYALGTNNDGHEHNITVTGSTLTVNVTNTSTGDSPFAMCGGALTVKNGATFNVTNNASEPSMYVINGTVNVIDGGKINVSNYTTGRVIFLSQNGDAVNVSGKGSIITVDYVCSSDTASNHAIYAHETISAVVNITDGGKLLVNNLVPNSDGIINVRGADVDLRGGIIEAHTRTGKTFGDKRVVAGKTLQYDESGLIKAYITDYGSYKTIYTNKVDDMYLYAKLIDFTLAPETKIGVKTGDTATLSAKAEITNTDETPAISYQWYKDGAKIAGATDATYVTPVLEDGVYVYKCEASATFSTGEMKSSTEDIAVSVSASGKPFVDRVLKINESSETENKLAEEGWAWNKEERKLYLNDANIKEIEFNNVTATIVNSGDSVITAMDTVPLVYSGSSAGLNVTGSGTLTLISVGNFAVITSQKSDNGPITISGSGLTVNCKMQKNTSAAIEVRDKFIITDGATVNINAPKGYSFWTASDAKITVDGGSKLNILTAETDKAVSFSTNAEFAVSGKDTVVTFDTPAERTKCYVLSLLSGCKLAVKDHAKMVINNCFNDAYYALIADNGEIDLLGGILEINAAAGKTLPVNKEIIRAKENGLHYNKNGLSNGKFSTNSGLDCIKLTTETAKWIYEGDKPYVGFAKLSENETILNGTTATLEALAEAVYATTIPEFHYQWYKDKVAIAGAQESTYTTEALTDTTAVYYCEAEATVDGVLISGRSDDIVISANDTGNVIRTKSLKIDTYTASVVNDKEGWSWDKDTKTLTLDHFTLRITEDTAGIEIPVGSTIILKGNNRIYTSTTNYGVYIGSGEGTEPTVIRGEGSLYTNCDKYHTAISSRYTMDILGSVEIGNKNSGNPLSGTTIYPVANKETGEYESKIVVDKDHDIRFTTTPKDKVYTSSVGGVAPKITVGAEILDITGTASYEYQWYATDNWSNPTKNAVAVTKGATLTAPVNKRGGKYYFCEVTATYNKKQYKKTSELYVVVVGAKGLEPLTKTTYLYSSSTEDHMADQGWSYDAETCTLTLNNLEAFIPFGTNTSSYYMFNIIGKSDMAINVVLAEGSVNHITECCRGFVCRTGNELVFTGKGILNYEAGPVSCQGIIDLSDSFKKLTINGGAKVTAVGGWNVYEGAGFEITVENAQASIEDLISYSYGRKATVHVAEGGKLTIPGSAEKYAKNVQIDKGGELYISSNQTGLNLDYDDGVGTIEINGILSIATKYGALKVFGANPEDRIVINSTILIPEGTKTLSELNYTGGSGYQCYCKGDLLIAPEGFTRIPITGTPIVSGDMKSGAMLTASAVSPADATVSYQWQYAVAKDSPDEFWEDFGVQEKKVILDESHVGKYIRVKVSGTGKYTGTVYSKPVEAVKANSVSVADFVVDNNIHYGRLSSDYANYQPNNYYPDRLISAIPVKAIADDKDAKIIIKNATTGLGLSDEEKTVFGAEGMLPIYLEGGKTTTNNIDVTVTNGTQVATYRVYFTCSISNGTIHFVTGDHITFILTDDEKNEVLRANKNSNVYNDFPVGKEYMFTAETDLDGWYVANINNERYQSDSLLVLGKRIVPGVIAPNGKATTFSADMEDLRCGAPEVAAHWAIAPTGLCIEATWETPVPAVYAQPDYTGRVSAELYDEDGNAVRLSKASLERPEGFYSYFGDSGFVCALDEDDNVVSLDPAKSYTLKVWYDAADKEICDVQEILVPAMDLSMNKHHIAVERPSSVPVDTTVNVNGRAFKTEIFPQTITAEQVMVEPAYEGGYVTVTVKKDAPLGTVYAVIYVKRPDKTVISEVLTIDIVEPAAKITAGLSETVGAMNIYSNDRLLVPVNIIGSGKPVVGAKFVYSNNETLSDKYYLNVTGDREVEILPVNTPDSYKTDWTKVAKSYTGTFKARIELELEDGSKCTTNDVYTLRINAKAPKVTVSPIRFNSFYKDNKVTLDFKADGAIVEARVDEVKSTSKTPAIPDWMYLLESGKKVILDNNKLVNNKGTGRLFLKVWVEGYRMPAQVVIPVAATYSAPKIKLDSSVVTLPANHAMYYDYYKVTVVSNDKKVSFEDMNITNVRVATAEELATLNSKDKATYAASVFFKAESYNKETGEMKLDTVPGVAQIPAGKILLYAEVGGVGSQKIALPLTIKTEADSKVTLKMSQKSITLNSNKTVGSEKVSVTLIPSAKGYKYDDEVIKVTDVKGNGDYSDKLDISRDMYVYTFKTNSSTQDGTYRVSIAIPEVTKPATVDVIVKGSVPVLKSDKASVNMDVFGDYVGFKKQQVTLSLSDTTIKSNFANYSYKIYDSKKNCVDDELYVAFSGYEGQPIIVSMASNYKSKIGRYTVELIYTMPGSGVKSVARVTVNVKEKLPVIKPSKTAVTLNSSLGKSDMATITFARPEGYDYAGYAVYVYDKTNKTVPNVVMYDYDMVNGVLTMYPGADAVPGQTYKVVVGNSVAGAIENKFVNNTITVKMAAANKVTGKAAITQKVTTKGVLDITRMDSQMQVVPSYNGWNAAACPDAVNPPTVAWIVYAYDKNKPYQYGDVEYQYAGDTGKVASSDSAGSINWFEDKDPSDAISIGFNDLNKYVQEIGKLTDLSYKIEVKTTYKNYLGTEDLVVTTVTAFKIKNGTVKLSAPTPKKVTLNRFDKYDSKIVKVKLTDSDVESLDIREVKMKDGSIFDATLLYVGGDYAYVAIGWRDDVIPLNVKAGPQVIEFYSGYNYVGRDKCNGTATVTVNVQ